MWSKRIVEWEMGGTLYLSVPFTWLLGEAEMRAKKHKGRVVAGGPAVALMGAPWADETPATTPFDVLSMHNPLATFTTRGCPNSCGFCAVPRIEGGFRELADWKPAPIVCDNNLLACSKAHFRKVIESLLPFPSADFNQGLEAARFTSWHAEEIARLNKPMVRFALDRDSQEGPVHAALDRARKAGLTRFGIYVLVGYTDTPENAVARLETVRGWDIRPYAMLYQPLDAERKNSYVAPGWSEYELGRTLQYYNRLRWHEHIPFDRFDRRATIPGQERLFEEAVTADDD